MRFRFPGIYHNHKNRLRGKSRALWLKFFVLTLENLLTIEVNQAFPSYLRGLMQDLNQLFPEQKDASGSDISVDDLLKVSTLRPCIEFCKTKVFLFQVGTAIEKLLGLLKNLEESGIAFKKDGQESQMVWDIFLTVSPKLIIRKFKESCISFSSPDEALRPCPYFPRGLLCPLRALAEGLFVTSATSGSPCPPLLPAPVRSRARPHRARR